MEMINNKSTTSYRHVKVVMAGMAYYSEMPYHSNALYFQSLNSTAYQSCDVVAHHPYFYTPEGNDANNLFDYETKAKMLLDYLSQFGKEIWATEWGWSTYNTNFSEQPFITMRQQADYILKRMTMLMYLCYDRVYHFTLYDLPVGWGGRDEFYGLLNATTISQVAKPSFYAMKNYLSIVGSNLKPVKIIKPLADPGNVHSMTATNGKDVFWIYWADKDYTNMSINGTEIFGNLNTTNQLVITTYEPIDGTSTTTSFSKNISSISITIKSTLTISQFTLMTTTSPQYSSKPTSSNSTIPLNSARTQVSMSNIVGVSWCLFIVISLFALVHVV